MYQKSIGINGINMKKQRILVIGCDGYIGFPLTMRLLMKDHVVVGVDNYSRRRSVQEMNSCSASDIHSPNRRRETLYLLGNYTHKDFDCIHNADLLEKLIKHHKFDTIINLAHNPSAPYSQIDRMHANYVLNNNIIGTNNLLWSIHQHCPECHYITIGSTGEYNHTLNVDIEEGYFEFQHKGRTSKRCLFPRESNSIYHTSKVASTYLIDYLTRLWGLKCTDVMQSIVFGMYTQECDFNKEYTRVDSDDCFGTVINRFVVQALLGEPMTIYGHGKHSRAFLSLNDSIQALELAVNNPAESGIVQTWNQLSEWHTMLDIAEMVKNVIQGSKTTHIDSPRKEFTGGHYYNYITDNLKSMGYEPTRTIEQEIQYMVDTLNFNGKSDILKSVIKPKVQF